MARIKAKKSKRVSIIRRLATALVLAVLLWVLFILGGRALCYIAIEQIGELTNTKIRTESVAFHTDGSVFIKEIVIRPEEDKDGDETIFRAEDIYARFSLGSLLLLRPRLKIIDVNDFVFNAQYDLDTGQWNLSELEIKPPRDDPASMPRIRLRTGTLQYCKISDGEPQIAVSVPINARLGFNRDPARGYSFEIMTSTMSSGFGKSRLAGFWKQGSVTVAGGIASTDIPQLEMAWIIDVLAAELKYEENNNFSLSLAIQDLQSKRSPALDRFALVGPAFLEKSGPFAALRRFFERYQPYGQVDVELDASGNFNELSESTLAGKVYCRDVAFCHHKFQYPVEHLAGQIDFTKNSAALNNLSGEHEDIRLYFNGWSTDFGPDWKYQIRITSDSIPLDKDLYNALNAKQREFWSAFSPTGFARIDYRFDRRSQTDKKMKLAVELLGADAVYEHFPYPLENLTGRLSFDRDKVIFSDLVSQVNERKITLNGEVTTHGTGRQTYDISVNVNNMPLDSTLEAALPDRQKQLYKRFCPAGLADGWVKVSAQDSGPPGFTADLSFKEAFLESEQFPLPISDITAKAVFTPGLIIVKDFSGRYGESMISLTGEIWPEQQQRQSRYRLALKFEQSPLNDGLFDLLPESLKGIVCGLNPTGKVNLSADLSKESFTKPPDYRISVECLSNSANLPEFPYPLRNITGILTIDAKSVRLEDVAATLGDNVPATADAPTIKLNGELALAGDTFSSAVLRLSASNILFDERFALALPQRARPLYAKLAPEGRFGLDFEDIRFRRADDGQKSIDFDGAVAFKSCGMEMSGLSTELDAVLRTKGLYKTGNGLASCQAAFDGGTLKIQGKSFTALKANIMYDPESKSWSTEDLIADCYGGKVRGKLGLKQPAERAFEYVLQTGFDDIDLRRFRSDTKSEARPENGYSSGTMDGSLSINAHIGDSSSRIGTCRLAISDMQIGKLSPLAKLLQVLRLTEPKDFAFDRMFVDSYIKQNGLFVETLDLSGRSLAFHGSGWMDLQSHDVDLTLTARGRRLVTDDPSILQSLTEGLGQAVVRMEVTGDFHDPDIATKTLPVIGQTLRIFGAKSPKTE